MKVLENELTVYFDCDDTLIMWGKESSPNVMDFICPYTDKIERLVPHSTHIQILKQQKGRGYHVVVWSAGGWAWAKRVVETLGIEDYVDEVRSKPTKFFDDLPAQEVLGSRVYVEFKETE